MIRYIVSLFFVGTILMTSSGCFSIHTGDEFEHIAPGMWKMNFWFNNGEERIPVLMEVKNTDNEKDNEVYFYTAGETLTPSRISFVDDTLFCYFDGTSRYLHLQHEIDEMEGYLYDEAEVETPIKAHVKHNQMVRFDDLYEPDANINEIEGTWNMEMTLRDGTTTTATLELNRQKGNIMYANLTMVDKALAVNNMRLEGIIQKDKLYLSGFDGKNVVYLTAVGKESVFLDKGSLRVNQEQIYWTAKR